MERLKKQTKSHGCRISLKDETKCGEGLGSVGTSVLTALNEDSITDTLEKPLYKPSLELSPSLLDGWRNSKIGTEGKEKIPDGPMRAENGDQSWSSTRCPHSKLENTASVSGFVAAHRMLHENPNTSENYHELIDYHNLTPEVPFVPSVAKSLPKKMIFFRKPKKSIKDLFVHKKHSCKNTASPCAPCRECGPKSKRTKKSSRCHDHAKDCQKIDDILSYSDSSSECCASVPEDAVSVQSFGSQAGCGEIFADEEYVVSLEGAANHKMCKDGSQNTKSPDASAFQQDNKPLAIWESVNSTIPTGQSLIQGAKSTSTPVYTLPASKERICSLENFQDMSSEINTPLSNKAAGFLGYITDTVEARTPSSNTTAIPMTWVTQKTENQESTIDEGYCDYISSEDHTGQSLTPVYSRKFPRDSYSGDALYELFYDPGEVETTPIFDDEMDLTHSVFGLPSPDLPLSMYSFHVGSEENFAPTLPVDLIKNDFLQSNWVGKDCLMKLCDTEISLTMGLVNWLRQRTAKDNKTSSSGVSTGDDGDLCQEDKIQAEDLTNVVISSCQNTSCYIDAGFTSELHLKQHKRSVTTPESQTRNPTNHICFQIFNINSPSTPSHLASPSTGASSMLVLAIDKESLCESCKASLKNSARKWQLCHSCIAFVEQIKTSDFSSCSNSNPAKTAEISKVLNVGLLPSPCSSYGIASDISLLSLVKQCANQMSSMKINHHSDLSIVAQSEREEQQKIKCTKKKVKSKPKTKGNLTGEGSLLEDKNHTLVTIKASDDLFLESRRRSRHQKTNPPQNTEVSHATRPTSLSLPNSSKSSNKEQRFNRKVNEKEHERLRRNKKAVVHNDGLLDGLLPEQKIERSRRMKK